MSKTSLVAVYGTLRAGGGNNAYFLEEAEFKGEFLSAPEFSMFSLGGFPGVKKEGQTSIKLEVYAVDENEAANIDALEGYEPGREPHFYDKQEIETPWGVAGIYIYVRPTEYRDVVESGDWLNRYAKVVEDGIN
jgi:gamma-glutamylcyclotransferase (GGCT)/AIG2-like uncharacterized protein YtfP